MTVAISHLGILEDDGLNLISIADAQQRLGARFEDHNIYSWMARNSWNGPLADAMIKFYGA